MYEELLVAEGCTDDLVPYLASDAMLLSAQYRLEVSLDRSPLMNREQRRHLQRLLRQGKFQFNRVSWKDLDNKADKPYVRQDPWELMVSYVLFWILSAAWMPVRHGSAYGWAAGTPIEFNTVYGGATGRSNLDAIATLRAYLPRPTGSESHEDYFVVLVDGKGAFEHLRHDMILKRLETRISDQVTLDLIADHLDSVSSAEGIGVGRGDYLATLLGDVAFSYVDQFWPEIGVQHRLQPCYLHPWRNQPRPRTAPDPWILDWFGDLSQNRPQAALGRPRHSQDVPPVHGVECGSPELPSQPVGKRRSADRRMVDTATSNQHPEADARRADAREVAGRVGACLLMDPTRLDPRGCGSGSPYLLYMRFGDDFLVVGQGGPERALWVLEALEQQLADLGLAISPEKTTIGSLYDGFRFLGVFWRLDRDSCELRLDVPYGLQRKISNAIHNVMWKTFRENPRDYLAVVEAVRKTVVDKTQYLRKAGADDQEVWAAGHDQLLRLARWYHWPLDHID
jgi:hypothetical protein